MVIYRTTSTTCVAVPSDAISEVTEAGNKAAKSSPTGTETSFEQSCVRTVFTSRDLDIITLNEPKCRLYHFIVVGCIGSTATRCCSAIPPVTTVLHPVCSVSI